MVNAACSCHSVVPRGAASTPIATQLAVDLTWHPVQDEGDDRRLEPTPTESGRTFVSGKPNYPLRLPMRRHSKSNSYSTRLSSARMSQKLAVRSVVVIAMRVAIFGNGVNGP